MAAVAPLAILACLGLILFLISTTIVLSLIPTYLPIRNHIQSLPLISDPQTNIFSLAGINSVTSGSILDAQTKKSIENQMQNSLSSDSTISSRNIPSVHVISATGIISSRRRKRETTSQILVIYQLVYSRTCFTKKCQTDILNWAQIKFQSLIINNIDDSTTSISSSSATIITMTTTTTSSSTTTNNDQTTGDIDKISKYWGNLRPYEDNSADYFGVTDTGLPDGCQVEQVHILHRHGARYPTSQNLDGANMNRFAFKIQTLRSTNSKFTGPLTFLNTWTSRLGAEILVSKGAADSYQSGTNFWDKYGRILYNARPGQTNYNSSGQSKILLRTNSESRMYESTLHWAEGFFGLYNQTDKYSVLPLPSTPGSNNTLAAYLNCPNSLLASSATLNETTLLAYASVLTANTIKRLSPYIPSNTNLTVLDILAMLFFCPYEYSALGSSDFCSLFTINEWQNFQQAFDLLFYKTYSFGVINGRALGIGYLEELLARLKKNFITTSFSSINSTLDSSTTTFPLDQLFYLDMASDTTIVTFLTALSLDYLRQNITTNNQRFHISNLTPFSARLYTEKIGCISSSPISTNSTRTQYSSTQYNYTADQAIYKFIRMRLNNGILPLNTIRGGLCSIGRTDGLCPMDNFLNSQTNASQLANFQYVCYGNFTLSTTNFNEDGTIFSL